MRSDQPRIKARVRGSIPTHIVVKLPTLKVYQSKLKKTQVLQTTAGRHAKGQMFYSYKKSRRKTSSFAADISPPKRGGKK